MSSAKCIVDDFGGSTHPYRYCIKPLKEMIDYDIGESKKLLK